MGMNRPSLLLIPLLFASCGGLAPLEVRHFGALREMMHEGRIESRVSTDRFLPDAQLQGLGACAELDGEITIVDGQLHVARPRGAGEAEFLSAPGSEIGAEAALLVVSKVARWRSVNIVETLSTQEELASFVAQAADEFGVELTKPFAFRVSGRASSLDLHIIDGRQLDGGGSSHEEHMETAVRIHREDESVELVGFHSRSHHRVWTHHDTDIHAHAVLADGTSGHVDDLAVRAGSVLFLPVE